MRKIPIGCESDWVIQSKVLRAIRLITPFSSLLSQHCPTRTKKNNILEGKRKSLAQVLLCKIFKRNKRFWLSNSSLRNLMSSILKMTEFKAIKNKNNENIRVLLYILPGKSYFILKRKSNGSKTLARHTCYAFYEG